MKKLDKKVAVITGGNSGIGLATAKEFIEQGARVIITGRNKATMEEALKLLGEKATGILSDASKMEDINALPGIIREKGFNAVDILFYNAGIANFSSVQETTEEFFDNHMNSNFKGAFFTVQKLLPLFNPNGSIILNSSVLASVTLAGNAVYGASKAALLHFGKTLSIELADKKIRANILSPGAISTPIYSRLGMTEEQMEQFAAGFIAKIPAARFGESDEIAKAVLYLASEDSSYVTGSELHVDGGTRNLW